MERSYTRRGGIYGESYRQRTVFHEEMFVTTHAQKLWMEKRYAWREGMDGEEVDTETNYTQKRVYTEKG